MKKISAVTWIAIWADNAASDAALIDRDLAWLIMSATQVEGERTESEWDALKEAAQKAGPGITMKDAIEFG